MACPLRSSRALLGTRCPALARLSPAFEEPCVPLREMADGDLSTKLAKAEMDFETASVNWAADPVNFDLKKV